MSIDAAWRTALPPVVSLLMFFGAEPLTAVREETAKPTEGSPSQTSRSADHMQEFTWISSRTHTNMGSTSHRACFLTRVAGNFGTDRFVRIYSSNGSWWLGGSELVVAGSPNTVSASARCSGVYSFTGDYTWSQGQDATPMGSIYGRSCFLTRVGGLLRGNGERVEVYSGNTTTWRLGGSSLHFGVHARAQVRRLWAATPSSTAIRLYGLGRLRPGAEGSTAHIVGVLSRWNPRWLLEQQHARHDFPAGWLLEPERQGR